MVLRVFLATLIRKSGEFETGMTANMDTSLPGDLATCPRVLSLKSAGNTVRVSVRVCNLSARAIEIPPKITVMFCQQCFSC